MNTELKIPNHIAIIMDGNGRWAKEKGKNRSFGHLEGSKTLRKITKHIFNRGVKVLSVYAFSTENFKRSKEEVSYLMDLFIKTFTLYIDEFVNNDIKIVFSKKEEGLPKKVLEVLKKASDKTKHNSKHIFNVCINYGGHDEIVDTTKKICEKVINNEIKISDITNEMFEKNLYNDLPPIDLLIRTSGEYRVSNFMLWQLAYAEFYFPDVYFPDFLESEVDKAIDAFNKRDRRFGGINYEEKNKEVK